VKYVTVNYTSHYTALVACTNLPAEVMHSHCAGPCFKEWISEQYRWHRNWWLANWKAK